MAANKEGGDAVTNASLEQAVIQFQREVMMLMNERQTRLPYAPNPPFEMAVASDSARVFRWKSSVPLGILKTEACGDFLPAPAPAPILAVLPDCWVGGVTRQRGISIVEKSMNSMPTGTRLRLRRLLRAGIRNGCREEAEAGY